MRVRLLILAVLLALMLSATVSAASPFVEPDVNIIHTLTGDPGAGTFGWVAEDLGDINGDGVSDLITSAPFFNGFAGKVYVFSGADGTLLNDVAAGQPALLGYSATTAGDVNNDGVPDYTAGAPVTSRAFVYSGADHSVILDASGVAGDFFGGSVAGAGDVNGDGYDDLIVGAEDANHSYPLAGRVYMLSGEDGSVLWTQDGRSEGARLGSAVGLVGDLNGDGVPDQVAGARGAGEQGRGEAYALSGVTGDILFTMQSVGLAGENRFGDPLPTFGLFFASGAGDVNGDGTPDIFIGAYNAKQGGTSGTGRAYVFSGTNGHRIRVLNAEEKGDGFGPGRGIGDVDGDGRGDLIVGAYLSDAGADDGGRVSLISGKNGRTLRTFTGTVPGASLGVDALDVGDMNGDGAQDYAITGFGVVHVVAGE